MNKPFLSFRKTVGKKMLTLLVLLPVIAMSWSKVHACSCIGPGPCGAFHAQDTLFIGKAIGVRVVETSEGNFKHRQRIYSFTVKEVLTGGLHPDDTVEVRTGMGGGDCGYGFELNESYVVDAGRYGVDNRLSAGICGATRPLSQATALLREVRMELAGKKLPDLTGTVRQTNALGGGKESPMPLSGVTVHLTPTNGNAYTATTDEYGIYTFNTLPPMQYVVGFDLPPHRVSYESKWRQPMTVTIPPSGGVGAACHQDTTAMPAGTVSGQVVDPTGKGMKMLGVVNLRRLGASIAEPLAAFPEQDGQFKLDFVPDGEYNLFFEQWSPKRETAMERDEEHPNGSVSVMDGQSVTGLKIVVK